MAAAAASTSAVGVVDHTPLSLLCLVIVAPNRECYDVIWSVVQATAERNRDPRRRPVIIPAVFNPQPASRGSSATASRPPSAATLESLFGKDDVLRLKPLLHIVHNLPYMCSANLCVALKVAKGTLCHPVLVQFPASCTFDERFIGTSSFDEASAPAEVIWARIPGQDFSSRFQQPAGLARDAFTLLPVINSGVVQMSNRKVSVSVRQFPITPACAITVFKCQGLTLPAMAVSRLRSPRMRKPRTALYVASPRTRESRCTIFLHPPTDADLQFFKPPPSLLRELERLAGLAVKTVQEFGRDGKV